LCETLDSLARQTCGDFEVIVVGDGDDPATIAFAGGYKAKFALRWIFHQQNLGQAAARNTGAKVANGDIVLFLDDDTPAHHDLVSQHLGHFLHFNSNRRIVVRGRVVEDRRAALPSCTDKFLQQWWEQILDRMGSPSAATDAGSVGDDIEREMCIALNCSIRREVFLRSGGFNPELRYSTEDMEYGHRLYRSGVRLVVDPLAIVYHRNTRAVTEHWRRTWRIEGKDAVKRVFEFGQRNPQTRQLASMHCGYVYERVIARTFWHSAPALRGVASFLERAINATGSRLLFGAWARLCSQTEYWSGARGSGCTSEMLRQVTGKPACALALHSISIPRSPEERTYYLSPSRFHRYLDWLKMSGYESASAAEWLRGDVGKNRVLLTFDDGYDDLYSELLPAIVQFKLKPLVFLVADRTGATNVWDQTCGLRRRNLLTLDQIGEMRRCGVEFGSHTLTHPWLPELSDDNLRREVGDSKRRLEDMLGTQVTTFAYPFGGVDQRVRAAVVDAGYELAFTTRPGLNWWGDPLCLNRAEVSEGDTFLDFALKLRSGCGVRQWFAARVHALETGLPTQTLRTTVRRMHRAARQIEAIVEATVKRPLGT
jgi:GT2 family glycosyltransferase/peptidoglycan/xylan/chitin deacetylase (PgdA/CDA1 family)